MLAPCLAMPRGYGQACAGVLFHTLVTSTTALLLRQRSWSWSLLPLIVRASLLRSLLNPCLSACAVGSCGRGACHARPTRRCKAAQRGMMSQQQRKWQSRKPLLTVVVPGADVAPDRSHLEPRRSLHGARRSSVLGLAVEPWVRRLRALALLCGALALALLLLLQAVRGRARHKAPLVTLGMGPTDEQARTRPPALTRSRHADPPRAQRCCGPAPCAREFIVPIVKASKRDTTVLEALTCAWQPEAAAWQLTMVWSDEAMPRSRLSLGLKDALYRAMRLLRCVHLRKRAHPLSVGAHAFPGRYGRVRDIESILMYPGEADGPPVHGLWCAADAHAAHACFSRLCRGSC